ncbi:CD48 antigen-like isoform X3 [Tachysurus fulvidraco]|uniref:CD48 antigen-like isoform X3 n=1 Tax=Tachysurus fulvidraco TaxID=1234273 RepID=UPI001FED5412|nr:CD48 antigen-like isoform X3 [Tachysurus fulvidraco]
MWILRSVPLLLCCLLCEAGDETVTLQELEGTTITLNPGITGIQSNAQILWRYGPEKEDKTILNSYMHGGVIFTNISEGFKERLQLDRNSGALTIRNISRTDSGVYTFHTLNGRVSSRTFSVSVYAPVSTPVIINERGKPSVISTETCFLLCSVENGEDVKLSWYRENERISITNNTDLSVPLNLSLQIQHNDTNTYICVSANPVSHKTTSLIITQLCDVSEKPEKPTSSDVNSTAHSSEREKEEENSTVTDAEVERDSVVYSDVRSRSLHSSNGGHEGSE